MPGRFRGKVAVVVGGNSGIGLASAKAFANEGAQVVIIGRDLDTLRTATREIGHRAVSHCSDISDLRQIDATFSIIQQQFAQIDVLFVNAGVGVLLPIESITEADWDWIFGINLKGAFFSIQRALPLMVKGSAIVLTGSIAALKGDQEASLYAASKAGLRALGRSLAGELVDKGIRVNVVSPGLTETALFRRTRGLPTEAVSATKHQWIDDIPMKRIGTPQEIAAMVLFLASDEASYVTGSDFIVDGGVTIK